MVRHPDGRVEGWHKLERPKVRQDAYGRATHLYLAGIDIAKEEDFGGDNHSSKSLALPLTVGRRLAILGEAAIAPDTREIRVEIRAEPGFDPKADVDVASLTFGAVKAVNFGKGFRATASAASATNLVVTFSGDAHGLTSDDFAAKMIGKTAKGGLLFGYARVPGRSAPAPLRPLEMPQP